MRARRLTSIFGLVATLLAAGCLEAEIRPAPDPAPVVWTGEHIELATNGDGRYCAGSLNYLDAFAGTMREEMGIEAEERLRFYLMSDEALSGIDVCTGGSRCVYLGRIYTDVALDTHEAVHALRYAALGDPLVPLPGATVFEEGLAVMHELDARELDQRREIEEAVASVPDLRSHMESKYYPVAGDFSRFLEVENGIESLSDFVAGQADLENSKELRERYENYFGEALEDAATRYRTAYPTCSAFARTRHPVECSAEPLVPDGGDFTFESSLSCEDPGTVGPMGGRMWTSFTFDVEEANNFRFTNIVSPYNFRVEIVDCDRGCGGVDESLEPDFDLSMGLELQPGRYLVRLSRPVSQPGDVHLKIGRF